jgi:hypothetical protein
MNKISLLYAGAFLLAAGTESVVLAQNPPQTNRSAAGTILATGQYSDDPDLQCDLLEVKRVSGGALLVRWRIINTAGQTGGLTASKPKTIRYNFDWSELFYIDPAENKKYQYLTDSAGNKILQVWWGDLEAGQQRLNWAKFPAPPTTSTKISVTIPRFAPFEDITVAQ